MNCALPPDTPPREDTEESSDEPALNVPLERDPAVQIFPALKVPSEDKLVNKLPIPPEILVPAEIEAKVVNDMTLETPADKVPADTDP